jgi:hypothetical protein
MVERCTANAQRLVQPSRDIMSAPEGRGAVRIAGALVHESIPGQRPVSSGR